MSNRKEYFCVLADKYVEGRQFHIVRPASLNQPKNNSVMFIMEQYMDKSAGFYVVNDCLIFWPQDIPVPEELAARHAVVLCEEPHSEYCRFFRDNDIRYLPQKEEMEVVDGAWIAKNARIGKGAVIMPGAYIGGECSIGDHVYIGSGTRLVGEVTIGNNVVIRENTVIGADGLSTDREIDGRAITMPQFGSVVIEDDVQIGASTVIARGAIDETRICRGSKIDNCTFISHNVHIGEDSFVVGETIMFGSSSVGEQCLISGNSTLMNAVHIGGQSIVGAGAVVTKSVPAQTVVKGNPAK